MHHGTCVGVYTDGLGVYTDGVGVYTDELCLTHHWVPQEKLECVVAQPHSDS